VKKQLTIFEALRAIIPCQHTSCFVTMAVVPAGLVCSDCGKLLFQYLPPPPEVLGYLSADWAWRYRDGKEWTSRD